MYNDVMLIWLMHQRCLTNVPLLGPRLFAPVLAEPSRSSIHRSYVLLTVQPVAGYQPLSSMSSEASGPVAGFALWLM